MNKSVAVVTGAARGIGKECAIQLAQSGFNLLINDLPDKESQVKLKDTAEKIRHHGGEVICYHADISDISIHQDFLNCGIKMWGKLDCLLNNAGISVKVRGDLLDVSPESFDRNIEVNTKSAFFLSQAFSKHLLSQTENFEAQHRCIINVTSINAIMLAMNRGEYCIAKAASSMTTKLFALRLSPHNIGVYEIRPGLIQTEMTIPAIPHYTKLIDAGVVPQKRWGFPDDIASTVCAMAQGKLKYTCGIPIAIDGGLSMPTF